jgi:hypothetical protein
MDPTVPLFPDPLSVPIQISKELLSGGTDKTG